MIFFTETQIVLLRTTLKSSVDICQAWKKALLNVATLM